MRRAMLQKMVNGVVIPYTAWYKLEESSGTVVFDESSNYDATSVNATLSQTGQVDDCYLLGGTNAYIYGNLGTKNENLPISYKFWVNADLSTFKFIISTGQGSGWYQGVEIGININGSILVRLGNSLGASSTSRKDFVTDTSVIVSNNWHQIVVIASSFSDVNVYVDTIDANATFTGGTASSLGWASNNFIGRRTSNYYSFYIDELTSYLGLWTIEQITAMYEKEVLGLPMI